VGDLQARTVERVELVARARDAVGRAPADRDSLGRALRAVMRLAPKIVDGRSAAEAEASLSGLVSLAASRHAVKLARIQPLADSARGVFQTVAVLAEGEADVAGLAALLRAIENAEVVLTVRSLAVQALDPEPRPGAPERLRIELLVAGWYLPRGGK
ncbi:MAG TPA: GspMb/PilO family protein, partial [Gemmatimonadales bacterium]|nr:GspMb/PilO family protein [Gemmatimonadales bacterium]